MPRYRTEFGVIVNVPAEKAARLGLKSVDAPPDPPRRRGRPPKTKPDE